MARHQDRSPTDRGFDGRPTYQSHLLVSTDRDTSTITGLRGDIHAFSDPDPNSGYLGTRVLLAQQGAGRRTLRADVLHLWAMQRGPGGGRWKGVGRRTIVEKYMD
jgi:ABC-type phosphate/phosphonate transport system substrate-binding protein